MRLTSAQRLLISKAQFNTQSRRDTKELRAELALVLQIRGVKKAQS